MAGQYIILPGVTAAASADAPRIYMSNADIVASKITSLRHVVSPHALARDAVEGVVGRCRNTGLPLVTKGINKAYLSLSQIGGKAALSIAAVTSGQAALALPENSLTPSYTSVLAVNMAAADIGLRGAGNFLSGMSADDTYLNIMLRWYGAESPTTPGMLAASTTTGQPVNTSGPTVADTWAIVVVDYNNDTRRISISLNQAKNFISGVKATDYAPAANSYLAIGYHIGSESLRSARVGDLYTFSDSLLRTDLGRLQLSALVAELKTEYGIAD